MKEPGGVRRLPTTHQSPPPAPFAAPPAGLQQVSEVSQASQASQPYRTSPLVLPHAKTIHSVGEQGNRFLTASNSPGESQQAREVRW